MFYKPLQNCIRNAILLFLVIFTSAQLKAQEFTFDTHAEFAAYKAQKIHYLDSIYQIDSVMFSEYKHFNRWLRIWEPTSYNDDGIRNSITVMQKYNYDRISGQPPSYNSVPATWINLGPLDMPGREVGDASFPGTPPNVTRWLTNGRMLFIEFDRYDTNRLYCGSPTGGLFYSNNYGDSWLPMGTDQLPTPGVSHMQHGKDETGQVHYFILTGDGDNNFSFSNGIFRRIEDGNWEAINSGLLVHDFSQTWERNNGRKLLIHPDSTNVLYATFEDGLYKTSNATASNPADVQWHKIIAAPIYDICFVPGSNYQKIVAASVSSIFYSINAGGSWIDISDATIPPANVSGVIQRTSIRVPMANPDILYAFQLHSDTISPDNDGPARLLKYQFSTQAWTIVDDKIEVPRDIGVGPGRSQSIAIDAQDENIIYISHIYSIFRSTNGGNNDWKIFSDNKHLDSHWLQFHPVTNDLWIADDGGIHMIENGDTACFPKSRGLSVANAASIGQGIQNSKDFFISGYDGLASYYDYSTRSFMQYNSADNYESIIDDTDSSDISMLFTASSTLGKVSKGTWLYKYFIPNNDNPIIKYGSTLFDAGFDLEHSNTDYFYVAGVKGVIRFVGDYFTTQNIKTLLHSGTNGTMYQDVVLSQSNPNLLYAISIGGQEECFNLFRISNCKEPDPTLIVYDTITPVDVTDPSKPLYNKWIHDLTINEDDPYEIWVCHGGYGDYETTSKRLMKVMHYKDSIWTDITEWNGGNGPLKGLTVEAIKYVTERKTLFIGTSGGVFFKNDEYTSWTKLEGLPHIKVTDIDYDPLTQHLRVATWGRGVWETRIPCRSYPKPAIFLDDPTGLIEWDKDMDINSQVHILSGNTLRITSGATISLEDYSKIIVEPGAQLIVDGATLTSGCAGYWGGIEVWGNSTESQVQRDATGRPLHQGEVIVRNGAVIRDATQAIIAIKVNSDGSYDYSKTGGIVKLSGAYLLNNWKGVWLGGYQNYIPANNMHIPNRSRIENCTFETNDYMLPGRDIYEYVGLVDVDGIRLSGNTFNNKRTRTDSVFYEGVGIRAFDASFTIDEFCNGNTQPCTQSDSSIFSGLRYGIRASFTSPNSPLKVSHAHFAGNYHGIHLINSNAATIVQSSFEVPEYTSELNATMPYGIHIDGGTGFKVEDNSLAATGNDFATFGIVIDNTGDANNEIYRNEFSGFNVAIEALDDNRGSGGNGLKFFCNENLNPAYDFWIGSGGVAEAQQQTVFSSSTGLPEYYPTGNIFSSASRLYDWDFSNTLGQGLDYYYMEYAPEKEKPTHYSYITLKPRDIQNNCLSKNGLNTDLAQLHLNHNAAIIAYNSSSTILGIWENGGNAQLDQQVKTVQPWEAYLEFNSLLGESPYLGDEVLFEIVRNLSFSDNMVKLLCVANPHSARNEELLSSIPEIRPNFPESYLDDIRAGEGTTSQLQNLQNDVAADKHLIDHIEKDMETLYRMDTVNTWAQDSLLALLARKKGLQNQYAYAAELLYQKDFGAMDLVLTGLPQQYEMTSNEATRHTNYLSLFSIAQSLMENNNLPGSLNESQLQSLGNMVEMDQPQLSAFAVALLMQNDKELEYQEEVVLPTSNASRKAAKDMKVKNTHEQLLKLYPNPAFDYVTIAFTQDNAYTSVQVQIIDMAGKCVLSKELYAGKLEHLLNIDMLSIGSYTVQLIADGEIIDMQKLNVLK